jgi:hypothetical protein
MVWKGSGHVEEEVCPGLEGGDEMAGFHHGGYRRVLAAVRAAAAMPAVGFLGSSSQAACKKLSLRFLKHLSPAGLL